MLLATDAVISQRFEQLVILSESTNGLHCHLKQDPTKNQYSYCETDLPCQSRFWTPPNQGQRQRPNAAERDDDKGFPEIPLYLLLCRAWSFGGIQKFTTVLAFDCFVLNFFCAERALFHFFCSCLSTPLNLTSKSTWSSIFFRMLLPLTMSGGFISRSLEVTGPT